MQRKIGIGKQDFAALRENQCFYIDKTDFIKQWWESQDDVTLITRPRRFGKTLNMDMLRVYFEMTDEDTSKYFEDKKISEIAAYTGRAEGTVKSDLSRAKRKLKLILEEG